MEKMNVRLIANGGKMAEEGIECPFGGQIATMGELITESGKSIFKCQMMGSNITKVIYGSKYLRDFAKMVLEKGELIILKMGEKIFTRSMLKKEEYITLIKVA